MFTEFEQNKKILKEIEITIIAITIIHCKTTLFYSKFALLP